MPCSIGFAVEQPQLVTYQAEADRHVPMIVLTPVPTRIGRERSNPSLP
ncbi:MAG: hypothetical protein ACRDVP_02730 [Acidimicrobiales bacterium]